MLAAVVGNAHDQELRHRPAVGARRTDHPRSDQGLRQGPRVREHRTAGGLRGNPGALDCVGAGRRSHCVFRADREAEDAHHPERRDAEDRAAHRAETRSTAPSRRRSARMAGRVAFAAICGGHHRHLRARPGHRGAEERDQGRDRRLLADLRTRRTVRSSTRPAPAATTSSSSVILATGAEDAAHLRQRTTTRRRSSTTSTRSSSRRRRLDPTVLDPARGRRERATSRTSGRST